MSARSEEFARRRLLLQLQCAQQREQFAQTGAELNEGLSIANRGLNLVRGTRIVPIILAAVSAAGALSRAGGIIRLVSRAWLVVNTFKRLRRSLK